MTSYCGLPPFPAEIVSRWNLDPRLIAGLTLLLAAIPTSASRPLYLAATAPWGLEPLTDQQFGGLLMQVGGLVPVLLGALLVARRSWTRVAAGA